MANNIGTVRSILLQQPENVIIEAARFYQKSGKPVSEQSYYKTLERMTKAGELVHLTKGMYYRPKKSRFGMVPISEKEIVSHFTGTNRGLLVGYRLYVNKGLTTQVSKNAEVLSVLVREHKKNISNGSVSKIEMELSPEIKSTIEAFEVLQNYGRIQDMNTGAFADYMKSFSKEYSDEIADYVLTHRTYKRATIAFMKQCMDYLGVPCRLGKYLSSMSEYKMPDVRKIYEAS